MSGGGGGYQFIPYVQSTSSNTQESRSIAPWLEAAARSNVSDAAAAAQNAGRAYTGQLTAGMNSTQQQAGQMVRDSLGNWRQPLSGAFDATRNAMGGIDYGSLGDVLSNGLGKYLSPYMSYVINGLTDQSNRNLGNNLNSLRDSAIRSGAAYGSRHGVQEGVALAENQRNLDNSIGSLLNSQFNNAAQYAQSDLANRYNAATGNRAAQMTGAQQLASLAGNQQQLNVNDFNNLYQVGNQQQQNAQNDLSARYNEFQRQIQQQNTAQQLRTQAVGTSPYSWSGESSTNSTTAGIGPQPDRSSSGLSSILGGASTALGLADKLWPAIPGVAGSGFMAGLGSAASGAASGIGSAIASAAPALLAFSDEDEKTNKQKLGRDPSSGLDIYAYDYKADVANARRTGSPMGPKRVGPMAGDIEKVAPSAVRKVGGKRVIPQALAMGIMNKFAR